jgi:hypothetical protein
MNFLISASAWLLRALEQADRALHGFGGGQLLRRGIDDLDQRLRAGVLRDHLREQLRGQVEVHAAGTARHGRADRARDAHADVLGVQHAVGRLAQRLGDGELVHLLVVALLQVHDLALARAGDEDHREAVGRRVRQRREAVEEARGRHGEADAGRAGEEAVRGGRVARVLLVAEAHHLQAVGLRHAQEVGDRDAGQRVERVDAIELERIDDEVEAVGGFRLRFGCHGVRRDGDEVGAMIGIRPVFPS